jgi:hypothetical protein
VGDEYGDDLGGEVEEHEVVVGERSYVRSVLIT